MAQPTIFKAYNHPLPTSVPADKLTEQRAQITLPYGRQEVQRWFFNGISILHKHQFFNGLFHFEKQNEGGAVSLSFNLKGNVEIQQAGHTYQVRQGQHNIIHSKNFDNTFRNKELELESLSILFEPSTFYQFAKDGNDTLKRFLDRMLEDKPVVMAPESLLIGPEIRQAIDAILHCPYTGEMRRLYLLSKSIEILVLQAEAFDQVAKQKHVFCKRQDDRDKLMYARTYLEANMTQPPSLSELAKEIGTNEYKLKRGFKELFGTTVFGYLSDFRLEQARRSLQGGEKPIAAIALDLGYSSSQHFSTAFKKKFGITPSQYRFPW